MQRSNNSTLGFPQIAAILSLFLRVSSSTMLRKLISSEHPKTLCEHHRDSVQTTSPDGLPLLGAYVPQCDEHGQYQSQQCHGSTGYCWCVDSRGQERPGTRTPPGSASKDCSTEGIASLLRVIFNKIPKFIDVNLKQFLWFFFTVSP
uniref:Thyroglobulin type-1 domain-containing protein n=1 Tax=Kryptolebias marmoratus TaxID=37003 RepID=A0A3Q2ZBZ4_KRYMA